MSRGWTVCDQQFTLRYDALNDKTTAMVPRETVNGNEAYFECEWNGVFAAENTLRLFMSFAGAPVIGSIALMEP